MKLHASQFIFMFCFAITSFVIDGSLSNPAFAHTGANGGSCTTLPASNGCLINCYAPSSCNTYESSDANGKIVICDGCTD